MMHPVWYLLTLFVNFIIIHSAEECEKNSTCDYVNHLGTKTPYRIVGNITVNRPLHFSNCEPEKIWMLVRHGTRNPSSSQILLMKERLPKIRDLILERNQEPSDCLRNSDLYALQNWKIKLDASIGKHLTHEGEDEMLELAERMQVRFPDLFPYIYSNTTYFFKYTATQRTKASAHYFATGLFGRQLVKHIWYPSALERDPVLRFYKLCAKWRTNIKQNVKTLTENVLFKDSSYMASIIEDLTRNLRLTEGTLTIDDVYLVYTMCAFETAWSRKKTSPWCNILNLSTLKVMEFLEDLKYYYRDGYGYRLTYQQACPAFNDMLNYFDSNAMYPKATVYFTHSGTILKMLAHMGLYNDSKPLLHTDFATREYQWKVSQIDAFGSNIAFVLNRCGDKRSVMVLHQERVVQLPCCDNDFCDLETIREYYSNSIDCDFDQMCSNNEL